MLIRHLALLMRRSDALKYHLCVGVMHGFLRVVLTGFRVVRSIFTEGTASSAASDFV
jgi:hypothetical protein